VTPALYPDAPLLREHQLAVGGGHVLRVQEFGHAGGIAAVLLHGGPGSGSSPLLRRFFDPARYRVVCIDQRGAGASRPRGSTAHNRSTDLLDDLRRVRALLDLKHWLVVGGSWGATLALAHAAAEPAAVAGLLLRASFLARREDIEWFFQGAARDAPQAWRSFAAAAPPAQRAALLPWLAEQLNSSAAAPAAPAALAWWRWEQALAGVAPASSEPDDEALAALVDRYRIQAHYLSHDCWFAEPPLLDRCAALPRVPTLLLHSRDDRVCRPEGAHALHARLPHSRLQWIDGAGHDPAHPAMAAAMRAALDRYAERGHFDGLGQAR
jgi:proline iminopeptidase